MRHAYGVKFDGTKASFKQRKRNSCEFGKQGKRLYIYNKEKQGVIR